MSKWTPAASTQDSPSKASTAAYGGSTVGAPSKRRSIVISFDEGSDVISSDLDFAKRLADMRKCYPTWHIRGIVHEKALTFIPEKPKERSERREGSVAMSDTGSGCDGPSIQDDGGGGSGAFAAGSKAHDEAVAAYIAQCSEHPPVMQQESATQHPRHMEQQQQRRNLLDHLDAESISTVSSVGNVAGETPRRVMKGIVVTVKVAPYDGKTGTIVEVKHKDRFKVSFGEGLGSWWCCRDDVVVAVTGASDAAHIHNGMQHNDDDHRQKNSHIDAAAVTEVEPVASLSTMSENKKMRSKVAELQAHVSALESLLKRAIDSLSEAEDRTTQHSGGGTRLGGNAFLGQNNQEPHSTSTVGGAPSTSMGKRRTLLRRLTTTREEEALVLKMLDKVK